VVPNARKESGGAPKAQTRTPDSPQKPGPGSAASSYTWVTGVTFELPKEVVRRRDAEAQRETSRKQCASWNTERYDSPSASHDARRSAAIG